MTAQGISLDAARPEGAVFHVATPARHWWDDIAHTGATMRLLRSEEDAEGGETVSVATLAALARDWYGDRLDPGWRPRSVAESQRILDSHGLSGDFWRLG